jgi:hypothetical protein
MPLVAIGVLSLLLAAPAGASHSVFVEGNNGADGAPGTTNVPAGTAGDWDGDGRIGIAEDTDNSTDRVFGTLGAALLGANGGVDANGHVIIVTSGRFAETVRIPNVEAGQPVLNGTTLIEAAPGVQAIVDAVVAGDPGNDTRRAQPGIVIDSAASDRMVILRNLVVRNFTYGLVVTGSSRVAVEGCRFDSNTAANVMVSGNGRVTMNACAVRAGGMRFDPAPVVPNPGHGVAFSGNASGSISSCTISGNTAGGVVNEGVGLVRVLDSNVFDNGVDLSGKIKEK